MKYIVLASFCLLFSACSIPMLVQRTESKSVPKAYSNSADSTNSATIQWKTFFADTNLIALIDTALSNNQELNIVLMEIEAAQNEVSVKKGEYLPKVDLQLESGLEKVGRYTSQGANDANTEVEPGKDFPEPLGDFLAGARISWEVDIWKKLRNSKKAAYSRFLATAEGKNFMVTNLIAEIANSYYELLALDNQLEILQQNIELQSKSLQIVKLQKESARATQLSVNRFEALVLNSRNLIPGIEQKIIETENQINFLLGRFPQPIPRNAQNFVDMNPNPVQTGLPAQLLENRPDIKQAELELAATKLDVMVAKADFYPSLGISSGLGLQAFNPSYLLKAPESLLFSLAGDLTAPLINRNAIIANYQSANARQIQAIYEFEQAILKAFIEVSNQVAKTGNLARSFDLKAQEVDVLNESVAISNSLFKSARADYIEVLLTQREALESKFELIETKKQQMNAWVDTYKALGGGWN